MLSGVGQALTDVTVWPVVALAVVALLGLLALGAWVTRMFGFLDANAPTAEKMGVALGVSLLVVSAIIAVLGSGGRSAFTPVGVGFLTSLALAVGKRFRRRSPLSGTGPRAAPDRRFGMARDQRMIGSVLLAAAFLASLAILYSATLVPGPAGNLQPLPIMDTAFYSALGRDVAQTGLETAISPSGFESVDGLPPQTWYHWGELWLAGGLIKVLGLEPFAARHLIVLPILVLAAALLLGTLVRRASNTSATGAFLTGFAACLFLAPIPLLDGPFFSSWASGLLFGITLYGIAVVAVFLAAYLMLRSTAVRFDFAQSLFVASTLAYVIPAHIVVGALGAAAVVVVLGYRRAWAWITHTAVPLVPRALRDTAMCLVPVVGATIAWGLATGHEIVGAAPSPQVQPFNETWRASVSIVLLGGGALYASALAWFLERKLLPHGALYVAAAVVVLAGAIIWGARLADYNTFHIFFAAIAIFGTMSAGIGAWAIWRRLRVGRLRVLAIVLATLFGLQLAVGALFTVLRLQIFGPHSYPAVPTRLIDQIAALPDGAKLAYACATTEEVAFWDPMLLAIGVYGGHPIIPMCFEADTLGPVVGAPLSSTVENPVFRWAPQRVLYPTATSAPPTAAVRSFLLEHGIEYIYSDAMHPNKLVPDASEVLQVEDFTLSKIR